ncbi:cytochrome c-type biogenesis protein ResA [Candidatus Symbiothrix dinenymphae]|nr:cytochrome c-type biogenesis protein ResA [Candidatus Symbiothrix dinenymphae]
MKKYSNFLFSLSAIVISGFLLEMRNKEAYGLILMLIFLLYSLIINKRKRNIIYITAALPVIVYIAFRFTQGFSFFHPQMWILFAIYAVWLLSGFLVGYFLSKWKLVQKHFVVAVITVISFILALMPGDFNQIFQFFAVGIIYLIAPYIASRLGATQKYVPWIIILPFMLVYAASTLINGAFGLYPIAIIPVCSVLIYVIVSKIKMRSLKMLIFGSYVLFLGYGWYAGFESYQQWAFVQKYKLPQDTYAEYTFHTIDGEIITPSELKGKIVVFDFWSTSCGVCFRDFPKFDSIYQKYKNRDDIAIYSVNLPIPRDTEEQILDKIKSLNYSFPMLLASEDIYFYEKQFNFRGVPHLMILDKNGKIVFNGLPNFKKKVAYNIEDMIDKLLK